MQRMVARCKAHFGAADGAEFDGFTTGWAAILRLAKADPTLWFEF